MEEEAHIIQRNKLILSEGKDDCLFLERLLIKNNDIQIRSYNGKNNLTNDLNALKGVDGFEEVASILIFRDSDQSTHSAIQSINSSLINTGLITIDLKPFEMSHQNNRDIGFVLFPGYDENGELYTSGTLEHLCLSIFKKNANINIIKSYIAEYQESNKKFKRPHKNELHTLFSFTDEYVGSKIGEVARYNGFDFNSSYLLPFIKMIEKM